MKNEQPREHASSNDPDAHKGATESDRDQDATPVSMTGQLGHRTSDPMIKDADSDFPEPGESPEHSGEPESGTPESGTRDTPKRR
jgi:hypothetical protein